jgi:hypothetical protein
MLIVISVDHLEYLLRVGASHRHRQTNESAELLFEANAK